MRRTNHLRSRKITTITVIFFMLAILPQTALTQQSPIRITDTKVVGKPEIVQLETGRTKRIYRNQAGQIVKEDVVEVVGGLFSIQRLAEETQVSSVYPNGKPAQVTTDVYDNQRRLATGTDTREFLSKVEHKRYDHQGNPIEKITYTADEDGHMEIGHREVTTWPPGSGPEGVTRSEDLQRDGSWRNSSDKPKQKEKPPKSTNPVASPGEPPASLTGQWRLFLGDKQMNGEYIIAEDPAGKTASAVSRDGKVWMLFFPAPGQVFDCYRVGGAEDFLGFGRKSIQLRRADNGDLHIWLTASEMDNKFTDSGYFLSRH